MSDIDFLKMAVALSHTSNEPVQCASILVNKSASIIAQTINSQHTDNLTASHAEMKAIAVANKLLGRKLIGVTAYGNCEPCTMCLTALIFSGVERIVFAQRLNDMAKPGKRIDIDCFEFIKKFPYQPKLEYLPL